MLKYKNLVLIGTSHIAKQSLEEVKKAIKEEKPDVIALELDTRRISALVSDKKSKPNLKQIFRLGFSGFIFYLIGSYASKKLGERTGLLPGAEMLTALNLAKKENIKIALVDQDIEITLKKLSKEFTFKEKIRFLKDLFLFPFAPKKSIKIDISKVPEQETITFLMEELKTRYPSLYRIIVEERNHFMAKKLSALMQEHKKIIAVVGAGHEIGIIDLIKSPSVRYTITIKSKDVTAEN